MDNIRLYAILLIYCYGQCGDFVRASGGDDCNELVCGSVVSKCLITQSCKDKQSDYKECLHCLGRLFLQCCNCVDMCPKYDDASALGKLKQPKSSIGDFEGVPELFDTLTADEDDDAWTTKRYNLSASTLSGGGGGGSDAIDRQAAVQKMPASSSPDCTLIYLHDCTTNRKCAEFCSSMGASSFRWFHDGCCECVGGNCFSYGINESHCARCPGNEDDDDLEDDDDELDYGEEETNYN